MSHYDYARSQELARDENSFASLIMAAMRRADSTNLEALKMSFPEIWDELQTRYNTPGGRVAGERLAVRWQSRNLKHQLDDLHASLDFACEEGLLEKHDITSILVHQVRTDSFQSALRQLAKSNPLAFGLVTRFHLEAKTSLMGDAEVVSRVTLSKMELSTGDIGWPQSILRYDDPNVAPENPEREARLAEAIDAWKQAHEND